MSEQRIIQNFIGYRALIAAEPGPAVAQLDATLTKLGLTITYPEIEAGAVRLAEEALAGEQAVLFVDADLNLALEPQDMAMLLPVIGLIGVEAPSRLKTIMRLGATATLRKPVYGGSVYSALFVGVNAFRQRRALTSEIAEHERRRHGRRYLIKAILKVMQAAGCDEDAAYDRLRRESMRQRLSIEEYCERFVRALPGAHEPSIRLQGATNAEKSTQGGK